MCLLLPSEPAPGTAWTISRIYVCCGIYLRSSRPFRIDVSPVPGGGFGDFIFDRIPPGCGALFLQRAAAGACKKQTAAPAPPRLFLPQAAARLRSPPPIAVPLRPAAAPPYGGSLPIAAPSFLTLPELSGTKQVRLLCSLHPEGAAGGVFPPEGGMPHSGRGDTSKRVEGGFRS